MTTSALETVCPEDLVKITVYAHTAASPRRYEIKAPDSFIRALLNSAKYIQILRESRNLPQVKRGFLAFNIEFWSVSDRFFEHIAWMLKETWKTDNPKTGVVETVWLKETEKLPV